MIYYLQMGCFFVPKRIPNKRCTPELKKLAAETMLEEKLSGRETYRQFEGTMSVESGIGSASACQKGIMTVK